MIDAPVAEAERRVHRAIATLEPAYRQLLQTLVRIPSPVGEEEAVQREVERAMSSIGASVDCFEIDAAAMTGVPGFNPSGGSYAGRPCIVGTLRGSGGGRSLILNAHVDTAPVDPHGTWSHAPFSGEIEGGRLYGRGAWDDKAGVVEMLLVAEALKVAGVQLRGDLVLTSVVDDETMGNGTLAALSRGHVADAAIVVDGTWPERFIVSHLGQIGFRVTLRGRSAPASVASRGVNPLHAVGAVMQCLRDLVDSKNATAAAWGANPAPTFVNVGRAQAGAWSGAVPCACVLEVQYGFAPPETPVTARQDVSNALGCARDSRNWPAGVDVEVDFGGLETPVVIGDPDNVIVRLLAGTVQRLRERRLEESIISGHCDLRHYQSNPWRPSIPACLYGPGGGKNAHAEDEYFELDHLTLVTETLSSAVLEWCA